MQFLAILALAVAAIAAPTDGEWNNWGKAVCTPSTVYVTAYKTEYQTQTQYKTETQTQTAYKTETAYVTKTEQKEVTKEVTKTQTNTVTVTAVPQKEYVTKEVYVTVTAECKNQWGKWQ